MTANNRELQETQIISDYQPLILLKVVLVLGVNLDSIIQEIYSTMPSRLGLVINTSLEN